MLNFPEYVAKIKKEIKEIDTTTAQDLLTEFPLIIDVREHGEHHNRRIPNAKCIPRGMVEAQLFSCVPEAGKSNPGQWLTKNKILLYCQSGARSALTVNSLKDMGLVHVYSLSGGMKAWEDKGFETEPCNK
ncbi:rhodanese-like domain-containing protein [Aestuariibacter sp. AA17]|uniref:Rhodanese-like domain-containing protein n=1 Tax=Fluctibacter corallii TaxID=2984329 RepID=A0ABT3AAP5_9ALTE|nr:rhodanese-like domain-containing protein [Aestuariibacter sp. AA17]MCV2885730.1 rhodanese-like domain-containing protein [Aestuariibacter sp. AA17]